MKKTSTFIAAVTLTVSVFAQSPEKMSYQAVIRNASNNLVTNTAVGMQISIVQGSAEGTQVYKETQNPTTNANGLLSIEIGGGAVVSGSFATINWANGPYFILTETDPAGGTNYSITGTSQLLSVPYALHAKTAQTVAVETDPVFGASLASGIAASDITNWNSKLSSELDSDPLNEIQSLSLSGKTLSISSANSVSLDCSNPWVNVGPISGLITTIVPNYPLAEYEYGFIYNSPGYICRAQISQWNQGYRFYNIEPYFVFSDNPSAGMGYGGSMFYYGTTDPADDACTSGSWRHSYWKIEGTVGGTSNSGIALYGSNGCNSTQAIYVRKR